MLACEIDVVRAPIVDMSANHQGDGQGSADADKQCGSQALQLGQPGLILIRRPSQNAAEMETWAATSRHEVGCRAAWLGDGHSVASMGVATTGA
jgi:hypothetical protein